MTTQFKVAFTSPIIKKVARLDFTVVSSYRLISDLPVVSKPLEWLVAHYLMKYLASTDLCHHCTLVSILHTQLKLTFYMYSLAVGLWFSWCW